jgi:hypothetical protein
MSLDTEFIYPAQEIIIHSAGPNSEPSGERVRISWPTFEGRDMAWYGNWTDWLGFFIPQATEGFVGAYNHETELGMTRIFPWEEVPGVKLFAWGMESPCASEYTVDGSEYFEMWGGPNRSFWSEDDNTLGPGESKEWTEYWCPFSSIDGLDFANRDATLSVQARDGSLHLGVGTTSYQEGTVILVVGGQELYRRGVAVGPECAHTHQLPLPSDISQEATVSIVFEDPGGLAIAQYEAEIPLQ